MRSNTITVVLSLIAGFAGAALFQQFVRPAQAAPTVQQVVSARAFHLVDASGNILARLEPYTYSSKNPKRPMLVLYGAGDQQTSVQPEGIYVGQGYGKVNIGMGYTNDNSPVLYLYYRAKGRMALMLDASKGGAPSMFMIDASGKRIWRAP